MTSKKVDLKIFRYKKNQRREEMKVDEEEDNVDETENVEAEEKYTLLIVSESQINWSHCIYTESRNIKM